MQPSCWFFNTDESEAEGENAHELMIQFSRVAAWGDCHGIGAELTLKPPAEGDRVFLYRAGHGMVASGVFADAAPFREPGDLWAAGRVSSLYRGPVLPCRTAFRS